MYIPTQRSLAELAASPIPASLGTPAASVNPDVKAAMPSRNYTSSNTTNSAGDDGGPLGDSGAFIAVMAACVSFLIILGVWTIYRKCFRNVDSPSASSDASSIFSASASAWRAEDSHAASGAVAAKHRKRLKKLDEVAPAQALAHWRKQKQTTHVQTFASVSNKLICAICLDLMQEKELIRELHCGHVYHASCLDLWVERGHHDCPMCKDDILGLSKEMPVEGSEEQSHEVQQSSSEEPAAVDDAAAVVVIDDEPATVVSDQAPVPALPTAHGANNEQPEQPRQE